jgi:hypothetical protein
MAKYAYDINKQTKIIDVQKQFPGGLKTVDTDDSLGKVYLRELDNLSLSEYSFLEKRHGQYVEHQITFASGETLPDVTKPIQGYFEYVKTEPPYKGIHRLLFIDGKAYVELPGED